MTPELEQAIEELYRVFSGVPRPRDINTSPYYDHAERQEYLQVLKFPLREIPLDDMGLYAGSVRLTVGVGDPNYYRYFLPRILECAVTDPTHIGFEPWIIADRLIRSEWTQWPEPGRRAVMNFLGAAFNDSLERFTGNLPEEWLCGILILGGKPEPHLTAWRESTMLEAAVRLADFACIEEKQIRPETLRDGRDEWERVPFEHRRAVWDWLVSTASLEQMKSWLDRAADHIDTEYTVQPLDHLEHGISVLEAKIYLS